MSEIMEKTLASLPKLLTQNLIGGGPPKPRRHAPTIDVQNFMKLVHRARTKSHETQIVKSEISSIHLKLKQSDLVSSPVILYNCFTKVLFCHLLGYDVNFIAIHAVNLAQQGSGFDKRLGYLMSCLLLSPQHEMAMLMMATLLRDLKSSNMGDNCIALKVAGEMVDTDTIPTILPEVVKKFNHQHDLVKEKAIHCFGAFYKRSPDLLISEIGKLNIFLTSRDPGVLMAVMNIFMTLTRENPSLFVGLGRSFLHILNQIDNRGFGSSYHYNMVPLPWLQISILKVLGNIGREDPQLSANICPVLKSLIEKTKVTVPVSLAVLVESVLVATKICPNEALLQLCSRCIMKLLASDSSKDMQYQGLGLLIALSWIKPSFASQHQVTIIECLTNEDPTIQSRTTLLLHAMANKANVKAICSKLFEQAEMTKEVGFRLDILMMVNDLVERLSPDIIWYVSMNFKILSHGLPKTKEDHIVGLVLKKIEDISHSNHLLDKNSISDLTKYLFSVLEKRNYLFAEFSLALQFLGTLSLILQEDDISSFNLLHLIAECLCFSSNQKSDLGFSSTMYPPDYFRDKKEIQTSIDETLTKLKSQCIITVTKMMLCQCIPAPTVTDWLTTIKLDTINPQNYFIQTDLDELADIAKSSHCMIKLSPILFQYKQMTDFSLSFLDSLVVKDILKGNECYKPSFVKHQLVSTLSASSSFQIDSDEMGMANLDDCEIHHMDRKIPDKWSDKDTNHEFGEENDAFLRNNQTNCEKFVVINSGNHLQLQEFHKKKKAAEELFAGLDNSDDSEASVYQYSFLESGSTNKKRKEKGRAIWEDDDNDDYHHHGYDDGEMLYQYKVEDKKPSTFNVSKLNPFGISKKAKAKPPKLTSDGGENINSISNTNSNNNNHDDEFNNFLCKASDSPSSFTHLTQEEVPWSDLREEIAATAIHKAVPSIYSSSLTECVPVSDNPVHSIDTDTMSSSAVDTLTDSDPDS